MSYMLGGCAAWRCRGLPYDAAALVLTTIYHCFDHYLSLGSCLALPRLMTPSPLRFECEISIRMPLPLLFDRYFDQY